MSVPDVLESLGTKGDAAGFAPLLNALGTLVEPVLEDDDPAQQRDWVLVRRRGIEIGFVDAAYFSGKPVDYWRSEGLLLDQITFYSDTRDGVQPYAGALPFGLLMSDSRAEARVRLAAYEASRRSYLTDCWDTERCRVVVTYKPGSAGLDSVHLKLRAAPLPETGRLQPAIAAERWASLFGLPAGDAGLVAALAPLELARRIEDDEDDREVAFIAECGLVLYFEKATQLRPARGTSPRGKVLGAVKFFRARDLEARQYTGELPCGLTFDDGPAALETRLGRTPDRRKDGNLTGHALWHLPAYSVHVLYSTIENHLFRIMLMAPGYWQELADAG